MQRPGRGNSGTEPGREGGLPRGAPGPPPGSFTVCFSAAWLCPCFLRAGQVAHTGVLLWPVGCMAQRCSGSGSCWTSRCSGLGSEGRHLAGGPSEASQGSFARSLVLCPLKGPKAHLNASLYPWIDSTQKRLNPST